MTELPDQNITQNKPEQYRFLAEVDATLLVWLVFLALGGGILTLYYAHLGYLPDIEWSSSIVYLATASLIGGTIGLLLALSLLIPGYIWSAFLVADEKLNRAFCFRDGQGELCPRTMLRRIGVPFGFVVLLNHLVLLLFPLFLSESNFRGPLTLWLYAIFSVASLGGVWIYMRPVFREMLNDAGVPSTGSDAERRIFKYVIWFALSILLSQISMILIYLLSGRPTGGSFLITTLFCTLGVLVSNHVVALHYSRSRLQAIVAALVIALLLLWMADRNTSLSSQILAFYGLGDRSERVVLILSDEGLKIVERLRLPNGCGEPLKERICGVRVLSRLGNEYYLDLHGRRFTLPKSAVSSWEKLGQ